MGIDNITEVNKSIDEIEHIEKFNPFHDAQGKFSSSNGMASYSANPKTKAGQMAIARSTAAGYGAVMNVHRESKGENIRQNDNWVRSGQKPNKSQLARAQANAPKNVAQARLNAHTNRVKGTMGATETAQAKHPQNTRRAAVNAARAQAAQNATARQNQQNQQANPKNQTAAQNIKQQTAAQNTKGLKANVSDVTLSSSHKLGIQMRDRMGQTTTSKKVANDHDQDHVKGKDISKTFTANNSSSVRAIDQVAKAQGWNKGATVTNDLESFQKAAAKSGQLLIRSVDGNGRMTANQICKSTMSDGNAPLGGHGGKVYGGGMYLVGAKVNNTTGRALGRQINASQQHSYAYANTQMMATVHPSAKIASGRTLTKLQNEYYNLSDRSKYGHDVGTYIASKGYDGAQWHSNRSDPYITMYNKSAMIFYGGVSEAY